MKQHESGLAGGRHELILLALETLAQAIEAPTGVNSACVSRIEKLVSDIRLCSQLEDQDVSNNNVQKCQHEHDEHGSMWQLCWLCWHACMMADATETQSKPGPNDLAAFGRYDMPSIHVLTLCI